MKINLLIIAAAALCASLVHASTTVTTNIVNGVPTYTTVQDISGGLETTVSTNPPAAPLSWKSVIQLGQTETNWAAIPYLKYDFNNHKFGYGGAILYAVSDHFWTGLRVDRIDGYDTSAGVQAQLQQTFTVFGFTFTPFAETSVGLGSSSLYGSAGTGAYFFVFGHSWARNGSLPPVTLNLSPVADYEHVVQSGDSSKNNNQGNAGVILNLNF